MAKQKRDSEQQNEKDSVDQSDSQEVRAQSADSQTEGQAKEQQQPTGRFQEDRNL